jgi:uncharacterized repeat protein (TIGR01451 family)
MCAAQVPILVTGVSTIAAASPVRTAPGTPGVPQSPTVLYRENFENNVTTTPTVLTSYVGANGMTYSADPAWLDNCNGEIVNYTMTVLPSNCDDGTSGMNHLRSMAWALGQHRADPDPTQNNALSAYTDRGNDTAVDPGPDKIQFETLQPVPIPGTGTRFITFSVDSSAIWCTPTPPQVHPLLQFYLVSGANSTPVPGVINTCTDSRGHNVDAPFPGGGTRPVWVGTYAPSGSVAFTGSTLGVRMVNREGGGRGNDAAIDNLQVVDATPQLDQAFSPATQVAGQTAQLTFTITNTSELASKTGWSFVDALPPGMKVVGPAATTTCTNGAITAPAGGTSITVTGDLNTGQASCTVTVNVTGIAGQFTSGPANVTVDGLKPPGSTPLEFVPVLTLEKVGAPTDVNGNGRISAGEKVAYTFKVTNPSANGVTLSSVAVTDPKVGPVSCSPTTLASGTSVTCTGTYTLTQADVDTGKVDNTATATASAPAGVTNPASVTDSATTPIAASSAIDLVKSVDATELTAGDTVTFTFKATNTGNVTLTNVKITETKSPGTGTMSPLSCDQAAPVTLAVAAVLTCTATYVVTAADVEAGVIGNGAAATGAPPTGPDVTDEDQVTVPTTYRAVLTLDIQQDVRDVNGDGLTGAGDEVLYHFHVTNTGDVVLTDVKVVDTRTSPAGIAIVCPKTTLVQGETMTCHAAAPYVVTAADVVNGKVINKAVATGTDPLGRPVESPPDEVQAPLAERLNLAVTGQPLRSLVAVAGLLLLTGAGMLLVARRPRRRPA